MVLCRRPEASFHLTAMNLTSGVGPFSKVTYAEQSLAGEPAVSLHLRSMNGLGVSTSKRIEPMLVQCSGNSKYRFSLR